MQSNQIPGKLPIPFAANAGTAFIRPIPTASQIGITAGAASLNDGFPPLTFQPVAGGGVPPFGQDFNGILNAITKWTQWQNAGGLVTYDSTFSTQIGGYPKNALLASATSAGTMWLSTVENNTTNPDLGGAGWVQLTGTISLNAIAAAVQSETWVYVVDTGTADALVAAPSPAVTSYTAGLRFSVAKGSHSNLTNTPTFNAGLGAKTIVRSDGSSIQPGDLPALGLFDLEYDGAVWRLLALPPSATRVRLTGNQTYYCSTSGSDITGNGSQAAPWLTLQHAFQIIYESIDLSSFSVTVQLGVGIYTGGLSWDGLFLGQNGPIFIIGNPSNPGQVIVDVAGAPCFHIRFGGEVFINGVLVQCGVSSTTSGALMSEYSGFIQFNNVTFDACPSTNHMFCNQGTILSTGTYTITSGASAHLNTQNNGVINIAGATATLTGVPVFTTTAVVNGGTVRAAGTTFVGSAIGTRHLVQFGGLADTGGVGVNFFPGNVAGSTPTGYLI